MASIDYTAPTDKTRSLKDNLILSLAAMGIVYGDIGTSPLYAFRECFHGHYAIPVTFENILGVLSLIFWSLIIVISIKYLSFILKADNNGEGGILALMALVLPGKQGRQFLTVLTLGLFGAALLYGDGVLTPAISVLSAVEGLKIASPIFHQYVVPISLTILFALFLFQKRGTGKVGALFGPIMLVWFLTLALLGALAIVRMPQVLYAVNPDHAVLFFIKNRFLGFLILGVVFLVVTGGEALYADLGHFGRTPIRLAWFSLVLPCLLLNYFGQGALILKYPQLTVSPFYHLAPDWALYPMIGLATLATIIASQAIISGVFSLTYQAVQFDYLPRLPVVHTSPAERGQIYIPSINWIMFLVTALLVILFKSSNNLAAAYGVAITTTMVITSLLAFFVLRNLWKWPLPFALLTIGFFLILDLLYFSSNILKIPKGGWIPLVIAVFVLLIMKTWRDGRSTLKQQFDRLTSPLDQFVNDLALDPKKRIPGNAIYMTSNLKTVPPAMTLNLKHNKVLHEKILLLSVQVLKVPYVPWSQRIEVRTLPQGFYTIRVQLGFMDTVDIQAVIEKLRQMEKTLDLNLDYQITTFFLGRETILPNKEIGMSVWRDLLFIAISKASQGATRYFHLPPERVMEVGSQMEV